MIQTKTNVKGELLQKILLAVFAAILIILPFHAFLSTWGGTAIGPLLVWKSWKEILLAAIIPLVIWYCVLRPDVARALWKGWLSKLIVVYVILHIIFAITSQAPLNAVLAGLLMNLRYLAMFVLAQVIFSSNEQGLRAFKKRLQTWLFATAIILSVLAIAQITVVSKDFLTHFGYSAETIPAYLTVDDHPDALRAYATLRGPNPFGSYILLPLALAAIVVVRQRRNILAGLTLGLGVVALALTSSRSAWLAAAAGAVVLAVVLIPPAKLLKIIKVSAIPFVVFAVVGFWIAVTVPAVRLAVFHSSPGDASLLEGSSEKHGQEVAKGVQDALQHPLGQGVGTSGPASFYSNAPKIPENYFVQLAQEIGFVGLALFVVINVIIIQRLWKQRSDTIQLALLASFAGITVINLFLHGWADDPTSMTWWGLAGVYLAAGNKR